MQTVRQVVASALEKKVAVGHFNVSNLEGVHAVFRAAQKLSVPVIIGVSEGEGEFVGLKEIAAVVETLRQDGYPLFLNADHSYSFERLKSALDAGFDTAIFDGTKLSIEENIETTKRCIAYARSLSHDVLIEGELGYIGQSSKILNTTPDGLVKTSVEDALRFVNETKVDMLAPAVGNIHGMLKGGIDPALDINLIKQISGAVRIPLVLHGASGNSDTDIEAAIGAGVAIVHINTELRVVYRDALKKSIEDMPDEVAPYKILAHSLEEMEKLVENKLRVFNRLK